MKRWILLLCGLAAALGASAQNDTLARVDNVYVVGDTGDGSLQLSVGGYQIAFAERQKPASQPQVTCSFGVKNVELGFSLLTSTDYSSYPTEQQGFLDLRTGKSIHFGFRLFDLGIPLDKRQKVVLHTGVHLMCDNYTFGDNLTLQRINGRVEPVMLEEPYRKSKLTTAAFGIPVQVAFKPTKGVAVSVLVYGDVVFNSHTKYKKPIEKARLSGVADFQAGVGASVSYRGFGVYAKYGLTTLFRDGAGPRTHPLTAGLYFGL